jgi:hypothetical protein
MEHIAALLLIVGCSNDLGQCTELPAPTPIFETVEECTAMLPSSLATLSKERPRVFAECVYVDPAMEEQDAVLTWDVLPGGKLVASIDAGGDVMVAANSHRTDEENIRRN